MNAHKKIESGNQMLLVFMTEEMRQQFRAHPFTLALDGTHGTNGSKSVLITVLAFGKHHMHVIHKLIKWPTSFIR